MSEGFSVDIIGDSGLFTTQGKGVAYYITCEDSTYLIDCGASPFCKLGVDGIKNLKGVFATHSHEDHRRWFTDLALFTHYHPALPDKINLFTTELIHEEYHKNSRGALERSLSADSSEVVDVPYPEFVSQNPFGPSAKYIIAPLGDDADPHLIWRVIDAATKEVVPPSKAKVFVNPGANRPRMLLLDEETNLWVEPESYYDFADTAFYNADRRDVIDEPTGLTFRAVKAPTWHGPPTIGILITRGENKLAFSSDTVYDTELWERLATEVRPLPEKTKSKAFEDAFVVRGDINKCIQRTWSEHRLEEAHIAYDGAIVAHDADFEQSVVHTSHSKFTPDADWSRLILTHTPEGFASMYPITYTGKKFVLVEGDIFEEFNEGTEECNNNTLYTLDADVYFKTNNAELVLGYKDEEGEGRLWSTKRGLTMTFGDDSEPPADDAELVGNYRLVYDINGFHVDAAPIFEDSGKYRVRKDGRIELLIETEAGTTGVLVETIDRAEK